MTHRYADPAFTNSVKAAQRHYGSRARNERLQSNLGPNDKLGPRETEFIEQRDTIYLATAGESEFSWRQSKRSCTN